MRARIYQRPKSAMQSGSAQIHSWVLEFEPERPSRPDPLMGWCGGGDTRSQIRLSFPNREAAITYAEKHGIPFDLEDPPQPQFRPKAYADNFRYGRAENWTH